MMLKASGIVGGSSDTIISPPCRSEVPEPSQLRSDIGKAVVGSSDQAP